MTIGSTELLALSPLLVTVATAVVEFLKHQWIARDGRRHRLVRAMAGIFGHGNVAGLGQMGMDSVREILN